MTSTYSQVANFILNSDANSNKNLSSDTYEFDFVARNVSAGSYDTEAYTIPLSVDTRLYQIYVNLSIDSGEWTTIPCVDRTYSSGNKRISINLSQNGTNLTLTLYLVNPSGSTQNFGDMTVSVTRRDFADEM